MKKILFLVPVLLFLVAGCYNASQTVELSLENDTIPSDQILNQLQQVAKEIEEEDNESEVADETMPTLKVQETDLVNLKVSATDADEDSIKFTFSEPLDKNGQWQTDYGDAGEYVVTITASDKELSSTKKVLLVVEKKNVAPVIEKLNDITATEGDTIKLEPVVSDMNKDDVVVTISDPVGDDGIWETDNKDAGQYDVTVTADDGDAKTEQTVKVVVLDKNVAPKISISDKVTIEEGQTLKLEPEITDADGDTVTYTISSPVGDDGIWETGFTDNGEYDVTITATDGKDEAKAVVKVVVEDVNKAPVIDEITLG